MSSLSLLSTSTVRYMSNAIHSRAMMITVRSRMFHRLLKYDSLCFLICKTFKISFKIKKKDQPYYKIQMIKLNFISICYLCKIYLKGFLNNVICDEEGKDKFTGHDEIVLDGNVSDQLDGTEIPRWNGSTSGWELHNQPDGTEQVDVGIVHSEINKQYSSPSRYPQFIKQICYDFQGFILCFAKILNISSSTVCRNGCLMAASIQFLFSLVGESARTKNYLY